MRNKNQTPVMSLSAMALGLLAALLGACSSTPVAQPAPLSQPVAATPAPATPTPPPPAAPQPAPASKVTTVTLPAYLDPKSEISTGRSVFFDFDAALLKPEFNGLVERHGRYLAANPQLHVKVEGNADERGSAEYNLALGQKRAQTVVQALKTQGAKDTQMEAISWGSERPRTSGHDESAWSQNRRADIQYPSR